jgi:hypothetical protein
MDRMQAILFTFVFIYNRYCRPEYHFNPSLNGEEKCKMPFMFAFEDEEDLWSSSGEEEKEMEEEADNEESSSTFEIK